MANKKFSQNIELIKLPFTPLSISVYVLLLVFLLVRLYRKKRGADRGHGKVIENTQTKGIHFNNKKYNCGEPHNMISKEILGKRFNEPLFMEYREKDLNDESTMNNLDEIEDNAEQKTISSSNSSASILVNTTITNNVNKRTQVGFDIFESTLKEINTMNDTTATLVVPPTSTIMADTSSSCKDNSVFLRKFKNSLLNYSGHNQKLQLQQQQDNIQHYKHLNSNNINCNNNNNFEQDYRKERFLSNTKVNKQNHLLGIITTQQQALKNHHKLLNSSSQISTSTFFSTSDFAVQNKKH